MLDFASVKTTVKNLFALSCMHTVYLFQEVVLGEVAKKQFRALIIQRTCWHLRNPCTAKGSLVCATLKNALRNFCGLEFHSDASRIRKGLRI